MRQRRAVVGGVDVLARLHRHRLRGVPVVRHEGQRRLVQRQVRASMTRNGNRHAARGPGGQLRSVARPRGVSLRHGEARLAEHEPRSVVLRDAHLHVRHGRRAVAITGDGVRQRHPSVRNPVIVLGRRNGHGLRNVPVGRGEGQARLVEGQVRARGKGHVDGHVVRWPGAQDEGVPVGSTLRHRQGLRQFAHPDLKGRLLTDRSHSHYRDDHRLRGDGTVVRPRNSMGQGNLPRGGALSS